MLFNSIDFIIFFPLVTFIYFVIPRKIRCLWLLVASYYFYSCWNVKYTLLIAISTVITYMSGILIGRTNNKGIKKGILALSLLSNLSILFIFKYANFFLQTLCSIIEKTGNYSFDKRIDLLLPVGISFYTFQALSYTIDVYRGSNKPEKNFIKYALFVSFFPQLVAGPIERTGNLLRQIDGAGGKLLWDMDRIRDGLLLMFWGYFQKLVIADRASILVNQVYNNYQEYGFVEIALASVLFSMQIYCDFGGYTNIARGASKILGFSLIQNFRQPYLALNIKDFWRRWHISLTSWFTDYLYIPLGGSRKGRLKKYFNIFIVFAVSGLWHGASWHFVAWGLLHAFFRMAGDIKNYVLKFLPCFNIDKKSFSGKLSKILTTFILVNFAWIFFASDSISHARGIISRMFTTFQTTKLTELGLNFVNWIILIFAIIILVIVDLLHEQGKSIFILMKGQMLWYRWGLYICLIWSVLMLGIYGIEYDTSQFLYFQF